MLIMGFQCYRDYPIYKPTYEFAEKISLAPYKKIYSFNDTIWVQFQTNDKTLYDKLSSSRIATDTTFLPIRFQYHKRFPINSSLPGDIFCSYKVLSGVNTVLETPIWYNTVRIETDCISTSYFVKIGFIPKATGIYSIELPRNGEIRNCPGKLSFINAIYAFTFDLADCNKDIYLSIPPQSRSGEQGFVDVSIDKKEIFVFKVE
jgi:hypothetical protein